jgi:hypothetical protein
LLGARTKITARNRHLENVAQVERVAEALQHLREKVVFIGGSIVGLQITDPAAPDVRRTKDVDIIIEVTGFSDHANKDAELRKLGFKHDISAHSHILRFRLGELIVDVLPEDGSPFGMKTDWYKSAVGSSKPHKLPSEIVIRLISAPLLVYTKFHAYADRGKGNLRESDDIGDILTVIDGRVELAEEVRQAEEKARQFIADRFSELLKNSQFEEAMTWQLIEDQQARQDIIIERMAVIAALK